MKFNAVSALVISLCVKLSDIAACGDDWPFPTNFIIGAATASYQIEGGWNSSDKGENVWDRLSHDKPYLIIDGSNGDVACDSFNKYKEDVAILKDIGFDFYRFSISWSRIFPTGFGNKVSETGIKYYHNLIDDLRSKGLEPFVTIHHWDHPQSLENLGGWTNELMVDWFGDYSRVLFREFGPKVKFFATINEPDSICSDGYGGVINAPALNMSLNADYICMHNLLKAHARAYHIYDKEFRPIQDGQIGIVLACPYHYVKNEEDNLWSDIAFEYSCGWMANPIFSKEGDYPRIMRERIDENSRIENWPRSRLPVFTQKEIEYIRGTADYFALNHYTSYLAVPVERRKGEVWFNDKGYEKISDPAWPGSASSWLKVVPEGFKKVLRKIKKEYNNPTVYVTENGFSDRGGLNDSGRLNYYYSYMKEMLLAIQEGCNVRGYTAWSILDNFEWNRGYTERFGIVDVDFNDPNRRRIYKRSATWFKDVLKSRKLLPVHNYINI